MKEFVLAVAISLGLLSIPMTLFWTHNKAYEWGQRKERQEITRHGFGRYVFDDETGDSGFEYGPEHGFVTCRTK